MNNILKHKYNGTRWLFVEWDADLKPRLRFNAIGCSYPVKPYFVWRQHLPKGNWQIHSATSQMSEDQAADFVAFLVINDGKERIFKNYDVKSTKPADWSWDFFTETALQSLASLITSLGGSPDKNYVVLKSKER